MKETYRKLQNGTYGLSGAEPGQTGRRYFATGMERFEDSDRRPSNMLHEMRRACVNPQGFNGEILGCVRGKRSFR